jgi:hypothetical protein
VERGDLIEISLILLLGVTFRGRTALCEIEEIGAVCQVGLVPSEPESEPREMAESDIDIAFSLDVLSKTW